jgi:glycogen synthase kinase 3 beta
MSNRDGRPFGADGERLSDAFKNQVKLDSRGNASPRKSPRPKFTYQAERVIASGSFGVVYQAMVQETQEMVAIKKVFQDKRYKNRELEMMKKLTHPCIVDLRHAFYTTGDKPDEIFLNLVMSYVPETVYRVVRQYYKKGSNVPLVCVKLYSYQLMRALAYLHNMEICHRDIKPQNLLVDTKSHRLFLCDFGSAKRLVSGEPNVAYICSRYYRAPELIFGATDYTDAIDLWSVGCVLVEMVIGTPLFPGESGVDQLVEIIKVLGSPTPEQLAAMKPQHSEYKFPRIKQVPWAQVLKQRLDDTGTALVSGLLQYDPRKRLTPLQTCAHGFFDEIRAEDLRVNGQKAPELFDWTKEERAMMSQDPELVAKLNPPWREKS